MEIFWDEYRKLWCSQQELTLSIFLQAALKSAECSLNEAQYWELMEFYQKLRVPHELA